LAYYLKSLLENLKIWQVSSKMKILSMYLLNLCTSRECTEAWSCF